MSYSLQILPRAQKELERLEKNHYIRIRDAIRELSGNPRPPGCLRLTGREGWRIRVGDYRIVYEIEDQKQTARYCMSDTARMFIDRLSCAARFAPPNIHFLWDGSLDGPAVCDRRSWVSGKCRRS
jgi:mRNA interferase RelE/StbE